MFIRDQVARIPELHTYGTGYTHPDEDSEAIAAECARIERCRKFREKRQSLLYRASLVHSNINARAMAQSGKPMLVSRFGAVTRNWRIKRDTLKDLGEVVRQYKNDNADDDDVAEQIRAVAEHLGRSHAQDIVGHLQTDISAYLLDGYVFCEDCDAFEPRNCCYGVEGGNIVCDTCCCENYRYSECMGEYIHSDDACPVYHSVRAYERGDADDYCTDRYGHRNLYEHPDNSGHYFTDEDDANYFREEDDEDDIPYYKDSRNRGYSYFQEIGSTHTYPALGVELEIYAYDASEAYRDLLHYNSGLVVERDGSLDDEYGLEIVTRPMGRTEWDTKGRSLLRVIESVTNDTPDGYGMHVHIHRRWLSPLAEARMMLFLCDAKNCEFVTALAGRSAIYSADVSIGGTSGKLSEVSYPGLQSRPRLVMINGSEVIREKNKIRGRGKYCPINWRDDCNGNTAEFRIFQSSAEPERVLTNLEFVWALYRWTLPESGTGCQTHHLDFINWLNQPANRKEFARLHTFLCQEEFEVVDEASVESPWRSHMRLPVSNPRAAIAA